jgi:hypothetical protein
MGACTDVLPSNFERSRRRLSPLEHTRIAVHEAQPPPLPQVYLPTNPKQRRHNANQAAQTRQERHQRAAIRMWLRSGRPLETRYLDYRYWQAKRCRFNPDRNDVWQWWSELHWRQRDEIAALSRYLRWH